VLQGGAAPYVAQVRAGTLTAQQALDLMRDNQEHLAVVRTLKRTLVRILLNVPHEDSLRFCRLLTSSAVNSSQHLDPSRYGYRFRFKSTKPGRWTK
jgi:hypothetical protein